MTREEITLMIREAFNSWQEKQCAKQTKKIEEVRSHVDSLFWKIFILIVVNSGLQGLVAYLVIRGIENVH